MTTENLDVEVDVEGLTVEEPRTVAPAKKKKAKAKKKATPTTPRPGTKAYLEVELEELTKRAELAENKAQYLFNENNTLKQRLHIIEDKHLTANKALFESLSGALRMHSLATKE